MQTNFLEGGGGGSGGKREAKVKRINKKCLESDILI